MSKGVVPAYFDAELTVDMLVQRLPGSELTVSEARQWTGKPSLPTLLSPAGGMQREATYLFSYLSPKWPPVNMYEFSKYVLILLYA